MATKIIVEDKPVPAVEEGMIVVLPKGEEITIAASIKTVGCGIEWDEVKNGPDFDADVSCLLIDNNGDNELIYYSALESKCGSILHTGDNLTGADDAVAGVATNEDDETIMAQLSSLPASVDKVVFFVNIHAAASRNQTFGTSGTMQARLYDLDTGKVFMQADLMVDNANKTSMVIGEFYRVGAEWHYRNIAEGGNQTLQDFTNANH